MFLASHPTRADREQPVAAWMTPRYVARSWHIPPDIILDALDVPRPPPYGPMSLAQLAEFRGVPVEQVVAEAEAAIADFRDAKRPQDADSGVAESTAHD